MNPMEFSADILPSSTYQNIAFEIVYAYRHVSKLIEIIYERLNNPDINYISKQIPHLQRL